jgi:hypothetical protein
MWRILNNVPTLWSGPKEASSRWCIAASYYAWDTIRPSGAIADRLCRLIWIILHRGVRYEDCGQVVCERLKRIRTARMIRQLRSIGYRVEPLTVHVNPA